MHEKGPDVQSKTYLAFTGMQIYGTLEKFCLASVLASNVDFAVGLKSLFLFFLITTLFTHRRFSPILVLYRTKTLTVGLFVCFEVLTQSY